MSPSHAKATSERVKENAQGPESASTSAETSSSLRHPSPTASSSTTLFPPPTALIDTILKKAIEIAAHSWEYGTISQALLEWHTPSHSIWHKPFPSGETPSLDISTTPALSYAKPFIRTHSTTLIDGAGAAGDPAALGIPALLIGKSSRAYWAVAQRQVDHLLNTVPRWAANGAISHREAHPELWADFVYMTPPFLAYYGVVTSNLPLVKEAARQCALYAEVLDTPAGVWMHIVGKTQHVPDPGPWSTGNAWAAAGMARVLGTLRHCVYAADTEAEQASLSRLIKRILNGAMALDNDASGLLRNYLDDHSWWGEISGTSLMAATALRMAVLEPAMFGERYTAWACEKMEAVGRGIDSETGVVRPAVEPLRAGDRSPLLTGSPEGQAFVVLMHAAWRDWRAWEDGRGKGLATAGLDS